MRGKCNSLLDVPRDRRKKQQLPTVYTIMVAIRQTVNYCAAKELFAKVGQFKVRK